MPKADSLIMYKLIVLLFALNTSAVFGQGHWKIIKQELVFKDPPFNACHASTIAEVQPGKFLIAFFAGSQEGKKDVSIWTATIEEGGTSAPRKVADGVINDTLRYPTWNPVLFRLKEGKLFLFYKVGPNPREWWGMFKTSDDNGETWSEARALPKGILGPIKNKPVQLADGTILSPSSIEESQDRWKVHIEKSTDTGKTWTLIPVDHGSTFDVIQPSILKYSGNKLQILCRSKQGNVIQSWSTDSGNSWGKLSRTMLANPNSGTDAVTLKDGTQLIVYNPDLPGKDWWNGRGKLRVAYSKDGISWHDIAILEDGSKEEYSYPAIIQSSDGLVHITYTFDRKNIRHVVLKHQG